MLDCAGPGLQKIRAEREDVVRSGKIVNRELIYTEYLAVCRPNRLERKRLVTRYPSTQRADPITQQVGERPPPRTGDRGDSIAGRTELGRKAVDGFVPGNLLEATIG